MKIDEMAREALPVLVRAAQLRDTLTYKALGDAIGVHHRPIRLVLGHIRDDVCGPRGLPMLTCLVVNSDTHLPGDSWLPSGVAPGETTDQRQRQFEEFRDDVFQYPNWDALLLALGIEPLPAVEADLAAAAREACNCPFGGQPESDGHRDLKRFVFSNPSHFGLECVIAHEEYQFLSGDRVDVAFEMPSEWVVVEVKTGALGELVRGVYQAIKYRALAEAQHGVARAFLVAYSMPASVKELALRFDVRPLVIAADKVPACGSTAEASVGEASFGS